MILDPHREFQELIDRRKILICVGSGGVGKTTTSAILGLQAAMMGKKVLVLTIDPARRLANSLGIDAIGSQRQKIPLERFKDLGLEPRGELWAMMLDMKESFDRLVERDAPDEESRDAILSNPFYQYFSTSLAGTQEYAASERIFEFDQEGYFDLIVLDTPPTTHALDFLEAPNRLADAVSSRALQWMYRPAILSGRPGRGILSVGTTYVLRTLSKFTGGELLADLTVFLKSFSVLFDGFEERARAVHALLTGDDTGFIVVTAPDTLTVEEALYFHEKLGDEILHVDGFVVNRVHPRWVEDAERLRPQDVADTLRAQGPGVADPDSLAQRLLLNAMDFQQRAGQDAASIAHMEEKLPADMPVARVPYFNEDIHSLAGLNRARQEIFTGLS